MTDAVGRDRLVLDLSCRKSGDSYYIVTDHWTKPPAPYTEDSLLAAMERAGNAEMDDQVERKGLGTPATRASIIEKLVSSGYAMSKKKQIVATDAGTTLISVMPEYLTSAQMTADWENRLRLMEQGKAAPQEFMEGIYALINTGIWVICILLPFVLAWIIRNKKGLNLRIQAFLLMTLCAIGSVCHVPLAWRSIRQGLGDSQRRQR